MKHKSFKDVMRVIDGKRPEAAVDKFVHDYLLGVALAPVYAAEEEYAALQATPDRENTSASMDGEVEIAPEVNHNAIRDARIAELELEYPHLVEPEQTFTDRVIGTDEEGNDIINPVPDIMPTLAERRPIPTIDIQGFKETAIVNELRRAAYPPVGDQLDALWKQLNQDRLGGKDMIQECDDVLGSILSVKSKFKKKEG